VSVSKSERRLRSASAWAVLAPLAVAGFAHAAPLTSTELTALCANAEDQAHCGRLIEARQLPRVARFVERNGDELRVSLVPFGLTIFRDSVEVNGAKSYAVWDYLEDADTLVLFATDAERTSFLLVQRRGGAEYRVASEPVLAPDRRHFATADFCAEGCENQIAVWRIASDGMRKELAWKPDAAWSDVSVGWRAADTLKIEYALPDRPGSRIVERRLADTGWTTFPAK
jgi:hypothetical protein